MKRTRKAYLLTAPVVAYQTRQVLMESLAALRSIYWIHWTAHWQVSGANFGSAHKMFEGFRYKVDQEIDTLAEKIVMMFGPSAVDLYDQTKRTQEKQEIFKGQECLYLRSLAAEQDWQVVAATVLKILEDVPSHTQGLEDFFQTSMNEHEAHIYQLQQTIRSEEGLPGIHKEPMDFSLVGDVVKKASRNRMTNRRFANERDVLKAKPRMPKFEKWISQTQASQQQVDKVLSFTISEYLDSEGSPTSKGLIEDVKQALYDVDQMTNDSGDDVMPSFPASQFEKEFWAWFQAAQGRKK